MPDEPATATDDAAPPSGASTAAMVDKPRGRRSAGKERVLVASQRQLVWWRFRRHKLAMLGSVVIIAFYVVAIFADFLAYAEPNHTNGNRVLIPPQQVQLISDGGISPHVNPVVGTRDPVTLEQVYVADETRQDHLEFLVEGYKYKLFGLIPTSTHLIGVEGGDTENRLALLGTDEQGRDVFSRLLVATRTSLTIGLVGVVVSLVLGAVLGGISGYYGGVVDTVIQRLIEILRSLPTIPLYLGLAAAIPADWGISRVYFFLTLILSLIGWTELARVVRGRFLQVRDEDFVTAAELVGARPRRIIFVHILPLFVSHIIAATTLALPLMIIAETSLSFLGLGLRSPAVSWGVMLQQAQNIQSVALSPWLLITVVPVVLAILAFNFVGDGLRDAADPYG